MSGIKTRSDKMKEVLIKKTDNSTITVIKADPKPIITILDVSADTDLGYKFTMSTRARGSSKKYKSLTFSESSFSEIKLSIDYVNYFEDDDKVVINYKVTNIDNEDNFKSLLKDTSLFTLTSAFFPTYTPNNSNFYTLK
jgi:hypothetical protein